jgi:ABC-type Na+ efflux pump permease subunit
MSQQKICQDCNQKHDCQKIYQWLGSIKGPSIVVGVIVAFLLPLMVFIAALAAFEEVLAKAMNSKEAQTALSFLLALAVTAVFIFIIKAKQPRHRAGGD